MFLVDFMRRSLYKEIANLSNPAREDDFIKTIELAELARNEAASVHVM